MFPGMFNPRPRVTSDPFSSTMPGMFNSRPRVECDPFFDADLFVVSDPRQLQGDDVLAPFVDRVAKRVLSLMGTQQSALTAAPPPRGSLALHPELKNKFKHSSYEYLSGVGDTSKGGKLFEKEEKVTVDETGMKLHTVRRAIDGKSSTSTCRCPVGVKENAIEHVVTYSDNKNKGHSRGRGTTRLPPTFWTTRKRTEEVGGREGTC